MAWYSYFLISLPETMAIMLVLFSTFGIRIGTKKKKVVIFVTLFSIVSYLLSFYIENQNLKLLYNLIIFVVLVKAIFNYRLQYALFLSILSIIVLMIFEVIFGVAYILIWHLDFQQMMKNPMERVLLAWPSMLAMFGTAGLLYKYKVRIKITGLSEY